MIARAKPQAFSMPRGPRLVLALWLTCTAATQATATPLADPPGLAPGTVFRRVFVTSHLYAVTTSTSYPPSFLEVGGLAGADYDVTFTAFQAGFLPGWNGTDVPFHAILSDGNTNAKDRLDIQGPIYNMQNELIALNAADLWDGTLAHAIRYDELGNSVPVGHLVWTGTNSFGNKDSITNAGNWLNPNSFARTGNPLSTTLTWAGDGQTIADTSQHLYAFSPPLTAVPEPSSVVLTALGLAAFGLASLKNRKQASSAVCQAICQERNQPRKSFTPTVTFNDPATVGRLSELRSLINIRRLACSHFPGSS